jgi:hypothetical protein
MVGDVSCSGTPQLEVAMIVVSVPCTPPHPQSDLHTWRINTITYYLWAGNLQQSLCAHFNPQLLSQELSMGRDAKWQKPSSTPVPSQCFPIEIRPTRVFTFPLVAFHFVQVAVRTGAVASGWVTIAMSVAIRFTDATHGPRLQPYWSNNTQ